MIGITDGVLDSFAPKREEREEEWRPSWMAKGLWDDLDEPRQKGRSQGKTARPSARRMPPGSRRSVRSGGGAMSISRITWVRAAGSAMRMIAGCGSLSFGARTRRKHGAGDPREMPGGESAALTGTSPTRSRKRLKRGG